MDEERAINCMRTLYELWADQNGLELTSFEVTKKTDEENNKSA